MLIITSLLLNTSTFTNEKHRYFMKARFGSKCCSCGDLIKAGKEILKDSQDRWVHKHCADVSLDLP